MRIVLVICGVLVIAGCSGRMVGLYETENLHLIHGTTSKEQVRESILEGAKYAGWEAKDQGNSTILATYQIRIHTVYVSIYYSDRSFRISYKSSIAMKMYCSVQEKNNRRHIVSGIKNCPDDRPPNYINANYKIWIDSLVAAIENSLAGESAALEKTFGKDTTGEQISLFAYYGEAEQEINTKSYDKNLWAKAFVEAEGDEQKRKARYIELRANQLYSENVSSISISKSKSKLYKQPTVHTEASGIDITGTYVSDIKGGPNYSFMKGRNFKITLKQSGDDIVGIINNKTEIIGTRKGDTIKFKYGKVTGMWKIYSDGTNLDGTWDNGSWDGKWSLTRIE